MSKVTAESLRETLNETIQKLLRGDVDVAQANAVGNLASKIIDTAKTEIYAAKVYDVIGDIRAKRSQFLLEDKGAEQ